MVVPGIASDFYCHTFLGALGLFPSYQQDFFSRRNWSEYANGFGGPGKISMKVNSILLLQVSWNI
jgi:hypothetical protein